VIGSFVKVDPRHVVEVGPAAALLYGHICWRSEAAGCWPATRSLMADETGLSAAMIRTATQVLRDRGWVTATRSSPNDATLVWRPVSAGQPDMVESTTPDGDFRQVPDVVTSAMSSIETVETDTPRRSPATEQAALPLLVVVPDPPDDPAAEQVDQGPPKTAQTLVARWVDGYRTVNGGADPHKAVLSRVAGQARNLAKACGEDHDAWVDAYHATYNAGVAGSHDLVRYLVPQQQRRQSSARRNVWAEPSMGGPDAGTMERFTAMMAPDQPRALGGGQ
jgi:helix-turn-helix protein